MKQILPLLALLLFSSCNSTGSWSTTGTTLLPSVISVAASSVIEKADNSDDRKIKALLLLKIADALLLSVDENTTGDQIVHLIQSETPPKPHWLILSTTIAGIYEQYRLKPNVKVEALVKSIATGLKTTANYYINEP